TRTTTALLAVHARYRAPCAAASRRELPRKPSWCQRQFLPELCCAHILAISRRAALEAARIGQFADLHRIKTGIAHQLRCDLDCLLIIARNRYREPGGGTVRFAFKDRIVERVEGAPQPRIGQILLRSYSNAIALDLIGNGAVAAGHGVVGVEHDLSR